MLECSGGLAQDVITTIGQAFELRFKEFLRKSGSNKPPPLPSLAHSNLLRPDDPEYYNDLPGKEPPSFSQSGAQTSNLIDLSADLSPLPPPLRPEYVNTDTERTSRHPRDPFDMSPFSVCPPGGGLGGLAGLGCGLPSPSLTQPPSQRSLLALEDWYHGPISRLEAEQLLRQDGDFLVRESHQTPGQFVLTGMQGQSRKHLLLVDPQGVVRSVLSLGLLSGWSSVEVRDSEHAADASSLMP